MAETAGDKIFDATPHRREQARAEGQIARSQDIIQAALLLAGASGLLMMGGAAVDYLAGYAQRQLGGDPWLAIDMAFLRNHFASTMLALASVTAPFLLMMMGVGIAANLFQSGILILPEKLAPDLTRIDPVQGFARLFSLAGMARLAFGIFKIGLIAAVAYAALNGQRDRIATLAGLTLAQGAVFLSQTMLWTAVKIGAALLVLAILDYGFQWWKREQDLRMSLQEMKDELRQTVGDPHVLQMRRATMREMALSSLSKSVPKANVVVSNPTELAIAIQYEPEKMQVPVVVAKGAGVLAQRIRRLALEHGIPIIERKPLAQALYKEVDVNKPIPVKLYAAVAEVLGYVYRLKGKSLPSGGTPGQAA